METRAGIIEKKKKALLVVFEPGNALWRHLSNRQREHSRVPAERLHTSTWHLLIYHTRTFSPTFVSRRSVTSY